MIKTGIVISIINKKAGIMTESGEFLYIKTRKVLPKIGEIHTGQLYKKNLINYKYALTAASLMFVLISSVVANAYYTPVTTLIISINPSVSLEANRWNKIISSKALNTDGTLILSNIKLKNKSIDAGLELLVKEAKAEKFINDKYVHDEKIISVDIKGNKNNSIDISKFKNIIESNDLNIIINATSSNNKKIDITVNNKKIDTSTLNHNSNKKESTNKNSNTVKDLHKKTSIDINTNKTEDKSSEIKEEIKNSDKTIINKDNKNNKDDKSENKDSNTSNENKGDLQDEDNKNDNDDDNSEKPSYEIEEKD